MAFNLRNWLEEKVADVSPFDGGKTAQTVRAQRQKPAPAQTVSRHPQVVVAQARPQAKVSVQPTRIQPQVKVASPVMPKPQRPQFDLDKGIESLKRAPGDFVKGIAYTLDPTEMTQDLATGIAETLNYGSKAAREAREAQSRLQNQNIDLARRASTKLRDPAVAQVEKDRWKQVVTKEARRGTQQHRDITDINDATIKATDPVQGAINTVGVASMLADGKGIATAANDIYKVAAPTAKQGLLETAKVAKAANLAYEQTNPRIRELDTARQNMQRQFDIETNPVRREQINRGLADISQERRAVAEGGYISLPGGEQVSRPLYHGSPHADKIRQEGFRANTGNGSNVRGESTNMFGDGTYLTSEKSTAKSYANGLGKNVLRTDIPKDARILKVTSDEAMGSGKKYMEQGYDGLEITGRGNGKHSDYVIFDESKITVKKDPQRIKKITHLTDDEMDGLTPSAIEHWKNDGFSGVSNGKRTVKFDDSLDVPKEDLIIKNGDGKAMSVGPKANKSTIESVDNKTWFHGADNYNKGESDTFFSADKSVAGDYGKPSKAKPSDLPKNPLKVTDKDELAQIIGYNGDPYVQPKGMSKEDLFDTQAKAYAQSKGHDSIYYESGSLEAPEIHSFGKPKPSQFEQDLQTAGIAPSASIGPKAPKQQLRPAQTQASKELQPTKAVEPEIVESRSLPLVEDTIQEITPKVKGSEKNVPVMNMTREGDVMTATNVNPKVKKGEKRYSVDDDGELIPDKKGATSLFTDDDGKVRGFRVGKEYFDAKDIGDLSTVNGYGSTLATARRNIERAFDKRTGDKVNEFLVDHQQAQATKLVERQIGLKKDMQAIADDLGINFKLGRGRAKKVSAAIQDLGEKQRTFEDVEAEFGTEMATKIANADGWFRKNYDTLLNEMNKTLTDFGYKPVPKRDNYYTHFQDESLWKSFGLKMQEIRDLASPTMQDANPSGQRGKISNALAGMSEQTKPNKAFNPFALERKGATHTSNAFEAFERYLNPTLNNIYMTPSIARARTIARAVAQEADTAGKDANKTIIQIREWANNLAGKSNRFDRPIIDTAVGDKALRVAGWAQRKAGENTIVGNLSTAFLQPIVLAQTTGKFGLKNVLLGAMQQLPGASNKAQVKSSFLKRRYTDNMKVTASALDKTKEVANTPLRVIEEESTRITWNAAHNEALAKGITGDKAIQYADIQTEKTVAGRSIGERPELYRSKAAGPFTMYQLEVGNFWQQMTKEMTKAQAARTIVAAYGINLALQEIIGRDVGFNPIDAAIDTYDEAKKEGKSNEGKAKAVGQRWTGEVVDNVPFVGQAVTTLFGEKNVKKFTGNDSNTGRFGVSSPLRTLVDNPWMMVSPVAGSQIKKTIEGTKTVMDGALKDKNGKTLVNIPQTPINYAKGGLFGKGAIPEVNQYYQNIGKKKVDQKQVQNQTDSKASRMGVITPAKTSVKKVKKPDTGWTDEYNALKTKFKEEGSAWSAVERAEKEKSLKTLEVKRHFSKDTTSLYSRSKADVYKFVSTDPNGKKYLDEVVRFGDKMVEAGIYKYNKYRDKYGNVLLTAPGTKTSSGGKKSGSSKKGSKAAKGKFDYKLTGFSKSTTSNSKDLYDLLKKAKMKNGIS